MYNFLLAGYDLVVINYFYCAKNKHDKVKSLFLWKNSDVDSVRSDVLIVFTRGLTSRIIFRDHFKSSGGNVTGDPPARGGMRSICRENNDEL